VSKRGSNEVQNSSKSVKIGSNTTVDETSPPESPPPSYADLCGLSDLASSQPKVPVTVAKSKSKSSVPRTVPKSKHRDLLHHLALFDSLIAPKLGHIEVAMLVQMLLRSLPTIIQTMVVSALYPSVCHYKEWTDPRHLLYYYGLRIILATIHQLDVSLAHLYSTQRGKLLLPLPDIAHELPSNSLGNTMRTLVQYHRIDQAGRAIMWTNVLLDLSNLYEPRSKGRLS